MMGLARSTARGILRGIFGEYQLDRLYYLERPITLLELDQGRKLIALDDKHISILRSNSNPEARKSAGYAGPEMTGFGIIASGRLSSVVLSLIEALSLRIESGH